MLGSVSDAEDIVQESFLRLHRAQSEGTVVQSPKSYLAATATRLAIDHLRSARVRREQYVGSWLPEPVIGDEGLRRVEMAESLSMAFLLVLETLSPVERAVFLLREVFDYDYTELAEILDKTPANCRQILARAKQHIESRTPRFETAPEKRQELAQRFLDACLGGDLDGLVKLLASDATFYGDGGGKATAVLNPVHGSDRVARLMHGIFSKYRTHGIEMRSVIVNGHPGAMMLDSEGRLINVFALDIAEGAVQAIRSVINPDKLRHLGPLSDLALVKRRMSTLR